jgi:hypothetical protein
MIKDLRKASLGYVAWKQNQSHFRKPWRYPEDITVPRILIEDCWETSDITSAEVELNEQPIAQTPTKSKSIFKVQSNGASNVNSNSNSASNSPILQKKSSKKKFKFKFDK